jgi:hypothetical protein
MVSHPITRSGDACDFQHLNIYTLGYQGVDVDSYVSKLKDAGVGIVADVRETPWSHKRGFCKNILSGALSKAGIDYVHVKSAGNPKENRRTAPDLAECLRRYRIYLDENPTGVTDLIDVIRTAASRNRHYVESYGKRNGSDTSCPETGILHGDTTPYAAKNWKNSILRVF